MSAWDPVRFDPQVELPPADGRLATLVARLPRRRIQSIDYEGRKLWIKRAFPAPHLAWRKGIRDRLAARPWPGMRWLPLVEWGSGPLLREAHRLVCLRDAGIAVPEIAGASSHWIALVDSGESMRAVLRKLGARNRQWLLARAAADLAELHAAGFWHGGAQVKNTVLSNGRRVRIDFDDGFDATLTLADLQARDLFFFLLSGADWVPAQGLTGLTGEYRAAGGRDEVVALARRETAPLCDRRRYRLLPGGDISRVLAAATALRDAAA